MKARDEEGLDPRLQEYLGLLRAVPRREAVAAARAKANYLAELEVLFETDQPPQPGFFTNLARWLNALIKPLVSFKPIPRTALSFSAILLIVVVLLFGWAGVTARAAETALPGDTLYSFKTGIEQVEVALAGDLDKQAGLYIVFASNRLDEIQRLVESGRYQKAVTLSAKFRFNIQKALDITNNLAKVNPARAAQRRIEIDAQLAGFTAQLDELLVKIPASYQPAFNNVIPPSQPGGAPTLIPPAATQTPEPTVEQDIPQNGNPNQQNEPKDNTGTDSNQENENSGKDENQSGETSEEGDEGFIQEESSGDPEMIENQGGEEEAGAENVNSEQSQPGLDGGNQDEHHSDNRQDRPSATCCTSSSPPPASD